MAEITTSAPAENNSSITSIWFSFEGRISRSTFWMKYMLPWIGILFVTGLVDAIIGAGGIIVGIAYLVSIWPAIATGVKRFHDRGRSGWFLLLVLIPLVNLWVLLEMWFLRGSIGENEYGADPVVE